ncbi:NlpC/P60 family protein [Aerococcaceae bacterium NML160702]|nr:NlpC/P60 family protein [Aerococcaceae bacterium NML160702]
MKHIEILDRDFNRLCFMDNDLENGLHYHSDKLTTSIANGVYTLDFKSPKTSKDSQHLKEGNYITFLNNQNTRILMTILAITENSLEKTVYCEDASIILINSRVEPMEKPTAAQRIDYYMNYLLANTGWKLGLNETEGIALLDLGGKTILESIREVVAAFNCEFYFSTDFQVGNQPKFFINVVKKRIEGKEGFRLSSEDFLLGIERRISTDNIITKLIVRGAEKTEQNNSKATPPPTHLPQTDNDIERVIEVAMAQRGKPYVWGANGPNSFDCSGFVSYAFRTANYRGYPTTGRPTTNSIWDRGGIHSGYFNRISKSELKRGDIILYDTGYTYPGDANHIGIYLGNNQVIHAGSPVQVQNAWSMSVVGFVRVKR